MIGRMFGSGGTEMLQFRDAIRHAKHLHAIAGDRAEAVAAQRALKEKIRGHREAAEDWIRIRRILRQRMGPRET